ncbi:Syntaxin-binding protein 1 [Astathelohania contejeani]|uniref:Syntaxin-binding protein 1 n=1 Tax=Astathelohania contejeani TaxID=164912 RepID=A0ABQ7HXQ7_9MICR|nr:Syntaxin-binding protein 1 [Thelohania contejeani]
MNIKEITKNKIINDVLKYGHNKDSWRVLNYHETTAHLLTMLFSNTEILTHNILTTQRIDDHRRKPIYTYDQLYFIDGCDEKIVKQLVKEIKSEIKQIKKKQKQNEKKRKDPMECELEEASDIHIHVVSISLIPKKQKEKLTEMGVELKEIFLEFLPVEKRVFKVGSDDKLISFIKFFGLHPEVHFVGEMSRELAMEIEEKLKAETRGRQGQLIIIDRCVDLFTPLIHFFTFQAILNDYGMVEGNICGETNLEKYELWDQIKYTHIAEINQILSEKAKKLSGGMKKLNEKLDVKGLSALVLEAPDNIKLKESVALFVDLLEKCFNKYSEDKINIVGEIEQNIATRFNTNGSKYRNGMEDFMRIIKSDEISRQDKLRLYLCLSAAGVELQENEKKFIIEGGYLSHHELDLDIGNSLVRMKERPRGYRYDMSRYVPVIDNIINSFCNKKSGLAKIESIGGDGGSPMDIKSLRKSEFVFMRKNSLAVKKENILCVFIRGGISYPEIAVADRLSKALKIEIVLGSNFVVTPATFIENLKNKQK